MLFRVRRIALIATTDVFIVVAESAEEAREKLLAKGWDGFELKVEPVQFDEDGVCHVYDGDD